MFKLIHAMQPFSTTVPSRTVDGHPPMVQTGKSLTVDEMAYTRNYRKFCMNESLEQLLKALHSQATAALHPPTTNERPVRSF